MNLMKEKGAHIIHRVLDDAPIATILKEITLLQEIYAAKKWCLLSIFLDKDSISLTSLNNNIKIYPT